MLKHYYYLIKPGIVRGNALAATAGFFFASLDIPLDWFLFFAMLVGVSLVVASGCVFNNIYDKEIDAKMERTKKRALPMAHISTQGALIFGTVLGSAGVALLALFTTFLATAVALVGWVVYVFFYTPLKHDSAMALYVGAVAGATPPIIGYTAVTGTLDVYALLLFAALYVWQIPHFVAIAIFRFDEYAAAGVPLVVKKRPSEATKRRARIVFYASLAVLLLFCLTLILQRWIR